MKKAKNMKLLQTIKIKFRVKNNDESKTRLIHVKRI